MYEEMNLYFTDLDHKDVDGHGKRTGGNRGREGEGEASMKVMRDFGLT